MPCPAMVFAWPVRLRGHGMENILIGLYYVAAITVIVLHFTGWLADRGLEWIVLVTAVLLFPMLYFAYTP